jgi:2-(1,2-epoxy-1,2-dihydrophenyl)acetyl-CoA isomerase
MAEHRFLEIAHEDNVTTVRLNRPERLNALNHDLVESLTDVLVSADEDEDTRVLVLTGAGRGFCSGFDVADLAAAAAGEGGRMTPPKVRDRSRGSSLRLARALLDVEIPIVAAVNGACAGAGLGLALSCDLVLASEEATFTVGFARRGLVPDYGVSWLLPRLVGLRKAQELCLLSPSLPAGEAVELGLVNRVVPGEALMDEATGLARRLASGAGVALRLTKRLLADSFDVDRQVALDREFTAQTLCFASDDAKEGAAAFLERREPAFTWR